MESSILTTCGDQAGKLVTQSNEVEVQLSGKDLFKMNGDARGTQITSVGGTLWVTQQGDPQDYVLCPGEKVKISHKGMVLVQGTPDARVRILPSAG